MKGALSWVQTEFASFAHCVGTAPTDLYRFTSLRRLGLGWCWHTARSETLCDERMSTAVSVCKAIVFRLVFFTPVTAPGRGQRPRRARRARGRRDGRGAHAARPGHVMPVRPRPPAHAGQPDRGLTCGYSIHDSKCETCFLASSASKRQTHRTRGRSTPCGTHKSSCKCRIRRSCASVRSSRRGRQLLLQHLDDGHVVQLRFGPGT